MRFGSVTVALCGDSEPSRSVVLTTAAIAVNCLLRWSWLGYVEVRIGMDPEFVSEIACPLRVTPQ